MVLVERNGDTMIVHELDPEDDPIDAAVARALLITGSDKRRMRAQLEKTRRFALGGYVLSVEKIRKQKGRKT